MTDTQDIDSINPNDRTYEELRDYVSSIARDLTDPGGWSRMRAASR